MDWNKDGKKDLIAGDTKGQVTLFLNTGKAQKPRLAKGVPIESDGKPITAKQTSYKVENNRVVVDKETPGSNPLADIYSKIHVADWNGDGLDDLLVGHEATIIFYKNVGSATEPKLAAPVKLESPDGAWLPRSSPYVADWDGDGVQDLLVGIERDGFPLFYRNSGSNREPKLEKGVPLKLEGGDGFEGSYRLRLAVCDWNNDGKLDLLVGNIFGGPDRQLGGNVWLFLRR